MAKTDEYCGKGQIIRANGPQLCYAGININSQSKKRKAKYRSDGETNAYRIPPVDQRPLPPHPSAAANPGLTDRWRQKRSQRAFSCRFVSARGSCISCKLRQSGRLKAKECQFKQKNPQFHQDANPGMQRARRRKHPLPRKNYSGTFGDIWGHLGTYVPLSSQNERNSIPTDSGLGRLLFLDLHTHAGSDANSRKDQDGPAGLSTSNLSPS